MLIALPTKFLARSPAFSRRGETGTVRASVTALAMLLRPLGNRESRRTAHTEKMPGHIQKRAMKQVASPTNPAQLPKWR